MNAFSIRDARASDAAVIADFQLQMAHETENRELNLETVLAGVRGALDNPRNGFYLIALDQNEEVIAALLVTFEWSDWRNGQFWWIQSVYVLPPWRGCGLFRALYAHIQARARAEEGVCGLRLYVERDNLRAQAVYAKLGMDETPYRIYEAEF